MKVILFGGTTEGREFAARLKDMGHTVTVSVAEEIGAEELKGIEDIKVVTGRRDAEGLSFLIRANDICIDATHPYAVLASQNISKACKICGIGYFRLLRKKSENLSRYNRVYEVDSAKEACKVAAKVKGNILLTVGVKELHEFSSIERERLFVRVLPVKESIKKCEEEGIAHRNIIAMFGPFSCKMNEAVIEQYDIRVTVSKDGGEAGGFDGKLEAAERTKTGLIVIKRPEEEGYSLEELISVINSKENCTAGNL